MKRLGLIFMCLFAANLTNAGELTVFAAASLMDALKEIGARWEQAGGERVVFNFASSSTLEQQISAGAPADVFLSADEAKMDQLAKQDLLLPGTRESILSNTLVIVVRKESRLSLTKAADIANVASLALAEPQTVPAGIYARECAGRARGSRGGERGRRNRLQDGRGHLQRVEDRMGGARGRRAENFLRRGDPARDRAARACEKISRVAGFTRGEAILSQIRIPSAGPA